MFSLDGGVELSFVDPRKLGVMWLVEDEAQVLAGLGPEPLAPGFTPEVLGKSLSGRDAPVKALLCDQGVVAGIGNIYADETLFLAGVHPLKRGRELSPTETSRLYDAIVSRLAEATRLASPPTTGEGARAEGVPGLDLMMPRSEGTPCVRCGTPVSRVAVRARGTYFCPGCQGQ